MLRMPLLSGVLLFVMGTGLPAQGQSMYEVVVLDMAQCSDGSPMGLGEMPSTTRETLWAVWAVCSAPNGAGLWTGGTVQLLANPPGYSDALALATETIPKQHSFSCEGTLSREP